MSDPILDEHLAQMRERHATAYSAVETSDSGALADLIISEELSAPDLSPIPQDGVGPLLASLKTASPDRKCMQYVLTSFAGWQGVIAPAARAEFLALIPKLAPATRDLGDVGMRIVLDAAALEPRILAPVAAYAMTTAEAIRAMAQLAKSAADHGRPELLEDLAASFPAEKMEENRDAEHLIPALAKMTEAAEGSAQVLAVAVELAKTNPAGARAAANSLTKVLAAMPSDRKAEYTQHCQSILKNIGARATGFCVNTLPGLYQRHDKQAINRFVELACEAGQRLGQVAGQAFLEMKTQASKAVLVP